MVDHKINLLTISYSVLIILELVMSEWATCCYHHFIIDRTKSDDLNYIMMELDRSVVNHSIKQKWDHTQHIHLFEYNVLLIMSSWLWVQVCHEYIEGHMLCSIIVLLLLLLLFWLHGFVFTPKVLVIGVCCWGSKQQWNLIEFGSICIVSLRVWIQSLGYGTQQL